MQKIALSFAFFLSYLFAQTPQLQWQKSLGGSSNDKAKAVQVCSDGSIILVAESQSTDGDRTNHKGLSDFWLVKTDAGGNLLWEKSYGGSNVDVPNSLQICPDSGYVMAGYTLSTDGDISNARGNADFWVVKTDENGDLQWEKSLGGSAFDQATALTLCRDGGYALVGKSRSTDGDCSQNYGQNDYCFLKLDSVGNVQWQKNYGGSSWDNPSDLLQTPDGGYLLAGSSKSSDYDASFNYGSYDYWLVKIDSVGAVLWQKSYGGSDLDEARSIALCADSGFVVAGRSFSIDGDIIGSQLVQHFGSDYWIVKLDQQGNVQWKNMPEGLKDEEANKVISLPDGYLVLGMTASNDQDVSGNHGLIDYWLVKFDLNGALIWQQCWGGSDEDEGLGLCAISPQSFVLVGETWSTDGNISSNHGLNDAWVLKLALATENEAFTENNAFFPYPNPTTRFLALPSFEHEARIELRNLWGELLLAVNSLPVLDLQDYPAGIYFLSFIQGDAVQVHKILKGTFK